MTGDINRGGLKVKNKQESTAAKVEMKADHDFLIQRLFILFEN